MDETFEASENQARMDETFEAFQNKARAVLAARKAVQKVQAVRRKTPADPAALIRAADLALRAFDGVQGFLEVAKEAQAALDALRADARRTLEQTRALLAGKVANLLSEAGFVVEGNLPKLMAGPYTIEFDFGAKSRVTVWFGPKKERLAVVPLDPAVVVRKVLDIHRVLFMNEFDDAAFLAELDRAYRLSLARLALPDQSTVPVTALMAEVAFLRQGERFWTDPRREHFQSFGRVEFAAALSRLRERRIGAREFRLETATLSQTRRSSDHLWVPRGRAGDGVNVAGAAFVRVPE